MNVAAAEPRVAQRFVGLFREPPPPSRTGSPARGPVFVDRTLDDAWEDRLMPAVERPGAWLLVAEGSASLMSAHKRRIQEGIYRVPHGWWEVTARTMTPPEWFEPRRSPTGNRMSEATLARWQGLFVRFLGFGRKPEVPA